MSEEKPDRLRGSEDPFRALFEDAADALFVHDLEGCFVDANRRARESLGYTRAELLAMSVFDVEEEQQLTWSRERWQDLRADRPHTLRVVQRRKDGSRLEVDLSLAAVEVGGRKLVSAAARPVAARRGPLGDLRDALTGELLVLQRLFELCDEAVAILDHEGSYLMQNPAHRELFGHSEVALAGRTPALHVGPGAFGAILDELAQAGRHRGEHACRTASGEECLLELVACAVTRAADEAPLYLLIARPGREREASEHASGVLEASLHHAQKMELVGQLAAGVAHDLNNLLTPILGLSEFELEKRAPGEPGHDSLRQIFEAAERGRELTRQLFALGSHPTVETRELDLCPLVRRAREVLRRVIPAEIELAVELADDVAPVLGDAAQLQQVLVNLATNARDALPHGGHIRIALCNVDVERASLLGHRLGTGGRFVHLEFTDDGHGMDAATLEHVFEPFFTRGPAGRGAGLGLTVVHGIVRQHGGFIQARSAPDAGTTFDIYLPTAAEPRVARTPRAVPPPARGETVLVVEDEVHVRALVARVLEEQGYRVLLAADGEDALRLEAEHEGRIHLLLTDVVMPGLGGSELHRALRARRPDLRVLFMSGYARDLLTEDGGLDPGISMIEKPFSASGLRERAREVLQG